MSAIKTSSIEKHAVTVALIALGVMTAGWTMYALRNNKYVNDARKGFAGGA